MKSMTAYGRAIVDTPQGRWTVEISSVNRKTLDIQISMPRHLLKLEFSLRKWLAPFVQRGQINVRASLQKSSETALDADLSRLRSIKKNWDNIARELGYDPRVAIDFKFLIDQSLEMGEAQEKDLEEGLKNAVSHAAQEWQAMRETEGAALKADLSQRLGFLKKRLIEVKELYPRAIEEYRTKLKTRLEEVSHDAVGNEERVMREVVILAEKLDVSEEMTRIQSHLEQFDHILNDSKQAIGRTMDFLIQELHREINTLSAKSSDLAIIRLTLEMKGELEKIREQVQNIE